MSIHVSPRLQYITSEVVAEYQNKVESSRRRAWLVRNITECKLNEECSAKIRLQFLMATRHTFAFAISCWQRRRQSSKRRSTKSSSEHLGKTPFRRLLATVRF